MPQIFIAPCTARNPTYDLITVPISVNDNDRCIDTVLEIEFYNSDWFGYTFTVEMPPEEVRLIADDYETCIREYIKNTYKVEIDMLYWIAPIKITETNII